MAGINGKRLSDGTAPAPRQASPPRAAPARRASPLRAAPLDDLFRPRQQAPQRQQPLRAAQAVPQRRNPVVYKPLPDLSSVFKSRPAAVENTNRPYAGFDSMWYTPEQRELTAIPESRAKPEVWPWRPDKPPVYRADSQKSREADSKKSRAAESPRARRERYDRPETESALTPEEWNAYTPIQQAAAQANADLAQAISRDREMWALHDDTPEQFQGYQARVKDLFGENASTGFKGVLYAPNTIAFLDERGIRAADLAGKTLDDFISGDVLMSKITIDNMKEEASDTSRNSRLSLAKALSRGQLAYQEKLAEKLQVGEQLISDITGVATHMAARESYGAATQDQPIALDKVRPELLGQYEKYLQVLARTDIDPQTALENISIDLQQWGAQPEETEQIWEGLLRQSRQATTGQVEWFPGVAPEELRSPIEVAQALGSTLGSTTLKRQSFSTAGDQ